MPVNDDFREAGMMFVENLSEQGLFLHCDRPLGPGTGVVVRFTVILDEPVVLTAEGRVVRVQKSPPGMGISFTGLKPEMRARLHEIVSKSLPQDSGPPVRVEFATSSSKREEQA